ncbi:Amidase [Penicillium argentinense]|uniref:Amidase n=1 Tax=Penicillium argentinense TaxID=1131581 RepID=A0A9W9KBD7_9EURO|nr:Amidase [Penicillium argentinense]KAJ5100049.1 Amidase [Penicillium argentinense]
MSSDVRANKPDVTELTIPAFHALLREGRMRIIDIVREYLARIEKYDGTLHSTIGAGFDHIEERVYREAYDKDQWTVRALAKGNTAFPPLHGVPILLKDNYLTVCPLTSAGSRALVFMAATRDSEVVSRLRKAGAIILIKTNMHEFALHGTTTSSCGGQTLNPYDLTRTPGGSSGGTGAALAMNLGLVGCGTDTMNSLRSPASACSIVGFRPSWGVVPCDGIVPVSETQDVAGPMARCVDDVRTLFDVMSGNRPRLGRAQKTTNVRIGILNAYFDLENADSSPEEITAENTIVQDIVRNALSQVQDTADITLVPINPNSHPDWRVSTLLANADTQAFEFRECLDMFLQSSIIKKTPSRSLEAIVKSGKYDKEAVTEVFTLPLSDPETYCRTSEAYQTRLSNIVTLKESVEQLYEENKIDALAYPHQRHLPIKVGPTVQPGRNGILAALTGRPAVCIPAGFSPATPSAVIGVPVGLELMGQEGQDEELLDLAECFEGILQARKPPKWE